MAAPTCLRLPRRQLQRSLLDLRPTSNASRCPHSTSFAFFRSSSAAQFSSSPAAYYPRDRSKNRGVSAMRSTGLRPRQTIPVKVEDLPVPVKRTAKPPPEVDPEHGLWQFFSPVARTADRLLCTAEEIGSHGRAWTVDELRRKSWEDLHALWWVCHRERNAIATENWERNRIRAGYGDYEAKERSKTIKKTQRAIKHVLTERYYAWLNARDAAMNDPEINLSPEEGEQVYTPSAAVGYNRDDVFEESSDMEVAEGQRYAGGTMLNKDGKEVEVEVIVKEDPNLMPPNSERAERRP